MLADPKAGTRVRVVGYEWADEFPGMVGSEGTITGWTVLDIGISVGVELDEPVPDPVKNQLINFEVFLLEELEEV
jgi:hypothetical protein